jgi:hypothetical protein
VHATSQLDGQALIDRVRLLRGPARLTRERATGARGCFGRSPSLHSVDDVGRARARVGLIARGDGVVLVEVGSPAARVLRLFDPGGSWPMHAEVPMPVATAAGRA